MHPVLPADSFTRRVATATPIAVALAASFALGCASADDATTTDDTATSEDGLHGTVTWEYDAVGRFIQSNGDREQHCTGTLISPHVVLTAAHCVDFHNVHPSPDRPPNDPQMLFSPTSSHSLTMLVDGYRSFGTDVGEDDLALLHLIAPIRSITPRHLRKFEPPRGKVTTLVGYGIHDCPRTDVYDGHEDDRRRYTTYHWGETLVGVVCAGDSGGPTLDDGLISQVASWVEDNGTDHYGHVWRQYDELMQLDAHWEGTSYTIP